MRPTAAAAAALPLLSLLLLLAPAAPVLAQAPEWSPEGFPNPKVDLQRCGRDVPSNICDPDLLLSTRSKNVAEGMIKAIWAGESPYALANCDGRQVGYQVRAGPAGWLQGAPTAAYPPEHSPPRECVWDVPPRNRSTNAFTPLPQVAVAVMRKMVVPRGAAAPDAARDFAKALHAAWGVGDAACDNGVLFLLSVDDRQVYISTGRGE